MHKYWSTRSKKMTLFNIKHITMHHHPTSKTTSFKTVMLSNSQQCWYKVTTLLMINKTPHYKTAVIAIHDKHATLIHWKMPLYAKCYCNQYTITIFRFFFNRPLSTVTLNWLHGIFRKHTKWYSFDQSSMQILILGIMMTCNCHLSLRIFFIFVTIYH